MAVHEEVLKAALENCNSEGVFRLSEILDELAHLNEQTVRTHVSSRCCVNAPKNHLHKWNYFRRIARGLYRITPEYFRPPVPPVPSEATPGPVRDAIHVSVIRDHDIYVAECLELAVVTQARSIDRLLANLAEAIELHLEGEDRAALGLGQNLRIVLSAEIPLEHA